MNQKFKADVDAGLSQTSKRIPSKYFYDRMGDILFQKIMKMPEYYLTDCEMEIFKEQNQQIVDAWDIDTDRHFNLIELGAGDGSKTIHLLRCLIDQHYDFTYMPVDISQHALNQLQSIVKKQLPEINIEVHRDEYFKFLEQLNHSDDPKVILFIGSNIGNMADQIAEDFLAQIVQRMTTEDKLLLGVDLIKSASIVLPAYNDSEGITEAFNKNLLSRINSELGGNFDLDSFEHRLTYDEHTGITMSYLVSLKNQSVFIASLNKAFTFHQGEQIQTEISRKYTKEIINSMLEKCKAKITTEFLDHKSYYADFVISK